MNPAVSARDPRVLRAAALLRAPAEAICLDGPELIDAAIDEGLAIEFILAADPSRWPGAVPASADALRALGALGQPATAVAVAARPRPGDPADAVLVLAGVSDAGNVGSILRTAAALGGQTDRRGTSDRPTVAITPTTADPMSRRALRAAAGASLRAGLIAPVTNLAEIPRPLAAAVPRGGAAPDALEPGTTIVLGNERDGLTPEDLAACGHTVTIPAAGFESLNVAAAAAILLWEAVRR
ncbi:MAG: TrmH family RNA methyltransferase [Solirubrobacteraceae bacterium]